LVTHSSKNALENHFDKSFELENCVKRQLLDEIQAICSKDVTILHVSQGGANGLGHAVLKASPIIVKVDSLFCNNAWRAVFRK
jgi:UTP--glucose-1-phosphate uridylyltransferase